MHDKHVFHFFIAALALGSSAVQSGYTCYGGATLSADQRSCSDGGIPVFIADAVEPAKLATPMQQATPVVQGAKPAAQSAEPAATTAPATPTGA